MATSSSIFVPTIPAQQPATKAKVVSAPDFGTLFYVVADTWKEKDNSKHEQIAGGPTGVTLLDAYWDPGVDATCTIVLAPSTTPLTVGCALTEATASGTSRVWQVMEVETESIGAGKPTRQMLKLQIKNSLTLTTS